MSLEVLKTPPWRPEGMPLGTILRVVAGSEATGTNLTESHDHDELGIAVESPRDILGLDCFEQKMIRSAGKGERSGPEDYDITIYSLRKFVTLALKGNPTILQMFFAAPDQIIESTWLGHEIRSKHGWFVSRKAGGAFLGYVKNQRERLDGTRGQRNVNRPELVEQHGYDTKYAGHMVRLGLQGVELMETGRMSLPMPDADREMVLAIRRGEITERECIMYAHEIEGRLKRLMETSPLQERPNRDAVNEWLTEIYPMAWGW